jgi:hypothetical protein
MMNEEQIRRAFEVTVYELYGLTRDKPGIVAGEAMW